MQKQNSCGDQWDYNKIFSSHVIGFHYGEEKESRDEKK